MLAWPRDCNAFYAARRTSLLRAAISRGKNVLVLAKGRDEDLPGWGKPELPRSSKGANFERADRRRGRPAHMRSPDDTPLRDANRDFMLGVITARCAAFEEP